MPDNDITAMDAAERKVPDDLYDLRQKILGRKIESLSDAQLALEVLSKSLSAVLHPDMADALYSVYEFVKLESRAQD